MKGKKCFVVLVLGLLLGSTNVWAEDEGWVPDDLFYAEHAEECVAGGREYYANGPNGQVIIYESPESSKVIHTMENGEITTVEFMYTNEKEVEWGFCEFEGEMGWIPMPYMTVVYDYLSFAEEYADQIVSVEKKELFEDDRKESDKLAFDVRGNRLRFWNYPGSERGYIIKTEWSSTRPVYQSIFVDEEGRTWAFITRFIGNNINRWMCIDGAQEVLGDYEELYPNGGPQRDKRVMKPYEGEEIFPDDYEQVQQQQKVKKIVTIVSILVSIVIAVVVVCKLWKVVKEI